MFDFRNPFKPASNASAFTLMDLNSSGDQPAQPTEASSAISIEEQMAVLRAQPVPEEINRGIRELLDSGKHPEAVFLAGNPQTDALMVFRNPNPEFQAIPLFSSPLLAKDYLKATGTPSDMQILGINMDSLPQAAEQWRARGVDSFFFNRCPRCPFVQPVFPTDKLIAKQQLTFMWATDLTIRRWRAGKLIRQYLGYQGDDALRQRRETLELLRDHVAYDNPYIHWLIALTAGTQGDESARAAAVANLQDFGPEVVREMSATEGTFDDKTWVEAVAKAHVGLCATFGLLKSQQQGRQIGSNFESGTSRPIG